jgi:DNA-binding NtrC family response regulator
MGPLRVLIVDDEEDLVLTMAERLRIRGFEVETAVTGTDALALVAQHGFSVLLVDVKMPGISGLDLMAEAKRKHPRLPVILFTGHSSVSDAERGIREGAFDYLMKPIDIEKLVERITEAARAAGGTGS